MKIVLASASLGRKKILSDLGLKFTVLPAKIDERKITASNHINLVKKIARAKAEAVLNMLGSPTKFLIGFRFPREKTFPYKKISSALANEASKNLCAPHIQESYVIIAADSMIYFQGKTYGKPKNKNEAKTMLSMLSGQTHEFITGLCVICFRNNEIILRSCKSQITFKKFTEKEIDDYVKIANVTSYAGGFAPNLKGGEIIKAKMKIKGSVSNVLGGLPLKIILPILHSHHLITSC